MNPLPANQALDSHFLEARCKLLDLAAILDRIGRGTGANGVAEDPRLAQIRQALEILGDPSGGRANAFSRFSRLTTTRPGRSLNLAR